MAEKTGISWTDSTFNPWIGCTKVGPGCDHCYAEALDKRHQWGGKTH
jgi:protein gp37